MKEDFEDNVGAAILSVNSDIESLLSLATKDYIMACRILKAVQLIAPDSKGDYNELISELQYHDAYTQKMQHIQEIHRWIISMDTIDPAQGQQSGCPNLIRLNRLQFQVATFEYLSSTNCIQTLFLQLLNGSQAGPGVDKQLFKNANDFLSDARLIALKFVSLEQMCKSYRNIDLSLHASAVSDLYSMEGERHVLHTYLQKPDVIEDDICNPTKENKASSSTIDLF